MKMSAGATRDIQRAFQGDFGDRARSADSDFIVGTR